MKLKDKVAIVRGGSAGIGKATASQLVKEGGMIIDLSPYAIDVNCIAPHCEEAEARLALDGTACVTYPIGDLASVDTHDRVGRLHRIALHGLDARRVGFEPVAPPRHSAVHHKSAMCATVGRSQGGLRE